MPVGPYESFDACAVEMRQRYDDDDTARRVCSEMEKRSARTEGWTFTESSLAEIETDLGIRATQQELAEALEGDEIAAELTEADPEGLTWDVTIIRPGVSKKGVHWPDSVLAEAAALYERVPVGINVYGDHEEDRLALTPNDPSARRAIVGWIENVRHVVGEGIKGVLRILPEGTAELRAAMVRQHREGRAPGLSHVVLVAPTTESVTNGRTVRDVSRILRAKFVDIVVRPSAGGAMETVTAADLATPDAANNSTTEGQPVPEPTTATPPATPAAPQTTPAADPAVTESLLSEVKAMRDAMARSEATAMLERKLGAIDFPAPAKNAIREKFTGMARVFTEAEVDADLKAARAILDSGSSPRPGGAARVQGGAGEYDRISDEMTESLFGVKTVRDDRGQITGLKLLGRNITNAPLRRDSSLRMWYHRLTGDGDPFGSVTGKVMGGLLTESITTSTFAEIFGDSVTRAMQAQYRALALDNWRSWASVVPARDFRTNRRVRMGGYPNLATVAQGGAYAAITSPGDEEATYAVTKRGNTEDLTLEAVVNDDLGATRRIPQSLAKAAAQTLHEFVWDFLATNPNVSYEAVALAAAGHNNIVTTALSQSSLTSAINKMRNQTDMSSSKKLGLRPRYLAVPIDLDQVAYELLASDKKPATAENDANFIREFNIQKIVVEYWSDANNYWLIADPADSPTVEVAFLGGNEEPELFIQDQPTVGNVFTNDKITWKIRHIYGGAILDHRAFVGGIVA